MEYIDDWNCSDSIEGTVSINGTFFSDSVIYFRGKENWMAKNPVPALLRGERTGIPLTVKYNGEAKGTFSAKISDADIQVVLGKRVTKNGETVSADDIQRAVKRNNGLLAQYKTSIGKAFTTEIGRKIFPGTYYSWLLSEKNKSVSLGESLEYQLAYRVKEGNPSFVMNFTQSHSLGSEQTIQVNGESISVSNICYLAEKFGHQQVTGRKTTEDLKGVQWFQPTDWKDISELKNAASIVNAIYMWWGKNKNNEHDIFLYVGIVGANSDKHTVVERIKEEMTTGIAYEFDVDVKQFRYSMLKSSDYQIPEILKTVEMQCINNISAVIPVYGKGKETVIHPLLGKQEGNYSDNNLWFADVANGKRIILINRDIRYHNT